jgi:hypothetical protein
MKRINPENVPTIKEAVLSYVLEARDPVPPHILVQKLPQHDPWEIREAAWELCAAYLMDFTMDGKLEKYNPSKPKAGDDC